MDFAENVQHKLACIRKSSVLQSHLDAPPSDARQHDEQRRCALRSSKYSLLAADVRLLHPDTPEPDRIEADSVFGGLDASLPTLVLFECVLAYIEPSRADWLLAHLGERFARIEAVSYDIALASDSDASSASRFGEVMLGNLEVSPACCRLETRNVHQLTPCDYSDAGWRWLERKRMRRYRRRAAASYRHGSAMDARRRKWKPRVCMQSGPRCRRVRNKGASRSRCGAVRVYDGRIWN